MINVFLIIFCVYLSFMLANRIKARRADSVDSIVMKIYIDQCHDMAYQMDGDEMALQAKCSDIEMQMNDAGVPGAKS